MIAKKVLKKRRIIDAAFKSEAVRLVQSSGLPHREIATDLGVSTSALGRWV